MNNKVLHKHITKVEAPTQVLWGKYDRVSRIFDKTEFTMTFKVSTHRKAAAVVFRCRNLRSFLSLSPPACVDFFIWVTNKNQRERQKMLAEMQPSCLLQKVHRCK